MRVMMLAVSERVVTRAGCLQPDRHGHPLALEIRQEPDLQGSGPPPAIGAGDRETITGASQPLQFCPKMPRRSRLRSSRSASASGVYRP